ncbi:MAG: TrkH family potassium uptake protein [Rhizobiaceae bacterium]|nr:TrkH family potassium uptake protein [Rhizobiaceae bacterium]
MDIRTILAPIGLIMMALAVAMLPPALVDFADNHADWQVFLASAATTGTFGLALVLAFKTDGVTLSRRQAILFVVLVWVVAAGVGGLPFYFSALPLTFAEAYFEAMSGLTTTGATTFSGLDTMPPGILLWRSMLHWIGGIGIIVLSIFILPFLSVGGQQLFALESSDKSDKPFARFRDYASKLLQLYVFLSLLCALTYMLLGMTPFEGINHAMATISTGGFSTSDGSMGHFQSEPILWAASFFMLLGGLPFVFMLKLLSRQRGELDRQIVYFLVTILVSGMAIAILLRLTETPSNYSLLATSFFHVISIITTTGFAAEDYLIWPSAALVMIFFITFLGGCSGSTSGGLKFFRIYLITHSLKTELMQALYPNAVIATRYGSRRLDAGVFRGALFFLAAYLLSFIIGAVLLALTGVDLVTAISGSITALANVGPGLGPIIGPAGNFVPLNDFAKWILSALMLLGRLEIIAVVLIFTRAFWRG